MSKSQHNTVAESTASDLSATTIFELLANERRQFALQYLTQVAGAAPVSELADQLALWEGKHTQERYARICTSLVHIHLPKLTAAGIVEYDSEQETIALQETATQLTPYLELAGVPDSQ